MQVTYIAPKGDAETVIMGGFTFHDGIAVEVPADARIAPALARNQHFIVDADEDAASTEAKNFGPNVELVTPRRGRPRKG